MKGDVIIAEKHHYAAALSIVDKIYFEIKNSPQRYTITVAGESGSGKSEMGKAIAETLQKQDINCFVLQQDDYYVYPPKTNDKTRRENKDWVGLNEVKLDLIDEHLAQAKKGNNELLKPMVLYDEDTISQETVNIKDVKVVIAEGTYTMLLINADKKIFINRNRLDTREHREKRNRAASELDAFTEEVLKIEHEIISKHKERADIIINKDYSVQL